MDKWTERLSEYLDGELSAEENAALEQHLSGCDDCRVVLADLRFIVASAGAVEDTAPPAHVWTAIAQQIGADAAPAAKVIAIDSHRTHRTSITLSMPQLAAAAVILLALGGSAVWTLGRNGDTAPVAVDGTAAPTDAIAAYTGTPPDTAAVAVIEPAIPSVDGTVRSVAQPLGGAPALAPVGGYDVAIAELEQAAAESRGRLDPTTIRVIEQTMSTIDRAIADARAALAADPSNAYLHRHLDRTMKQKLDLLRRSAKIDRGGA